MKRAASTIFLFFICTSSLYGASFQCSKATANVEKLICSDSEVSILDDKLATTYQQRVAASEDEAGLKIAQRRWLRDKRDRCASLPCLKEAYETRLYELKWDSNYADRAPKKELVKTLCEKLIMKSERGKILFSQKGIEDVNNDGHPETFKQCLGGTMNTPCTDYFDHNGKQIEFEQAGFEWKDYWTYGIRAFRFAGRTFFLHSRDDDLAELSHLSYITPMNKEYVLCEFDTLVTSAIALQSPDSDGVCQAALESSSSIEPIELSDSIVQPDFLHRPETYAKGFGFVDINNDGTPEKVVELNYTSGGGRGCDNNYYELLDSSGKSLSSEKERIPFLAMQGAGDGGYWGRSCGHIENRLFRYKNKTYYEHNVENQQGDENTISLLVGNATKTVCKYRREIETALKSK